ncbi:CPBP family glutamic-type intramembrane protease [Luteimonas sp. RD2P54]|uniref:CPBP family glutamic-type intramembrane protease n=1 Tax=Luteimonas endophytica TaxID=3042023 RepID=A0ABT6JBQ2_9GAMM|nr:CPBP family glutamic-type intramembrane protease [Luteimonas endophytica]MDH5823618.1 CPBP family glutamic-type intramembrane protease [Luteimonas endophytica]
MTLVGGAAAPSRRRWLVAVLLGSLLWAVAIGVSFVLPQVLLGLRPGGGAYYAVVALLQLSLAAAAIQLARRAGTLGWSELGITRAAWRADALIGLAVAAGFALLQFGLIIPLTGGAERSDVATNLAQLRSGPHAAAGMFALGVLGALAEELLFRGLLLHGIAAALGGARAARATAVCIVVVLFGAVHGYQGWAGMVDTALYGGLTLSLLCLWRGGRIAAAVAAHAGWNAIAVGCLLLL